MIIKEADDKQHIFSALSQLLEHPQADSATKKKIEQEIKNIQAGAKGESEVAYELRAHMVSRKFWFVIHDLRLEIDGLVAQIDHLLINRYLEVNVCESKHFSEGVAINDHGEFTAFFGGKPYGVPSPIEQNRRHIAILERLFKSGAIRLPTRLGITLQPTFKNLVLVSQRARINRPQETFAGLDGVIKSDQLVRRIEKEADEVGIGALAKVVSTETLQDICDQLVALHRPIQVNWAAKFGLHPAGLAPSNPRPAPVSAARQEDHSATPDAQFVAALEPSPEEKPKQKLVCASCSEAVPYNVAKFCWMNKGKFGGRILCRACQTKA